MNSTGTGNTVQLEADIVIIGSGGGLAAAVAAAENGAKNITVLEKQSVPGGNSALAGGIFGCESPVQKRLNITADRDEYFKAALKWAHCHRIDPRILRAYINKSGDTIRWLEEKGVQFEAHGALHLPVGRGAALMQALIQNCQDRGIKLLLNTSGKRIMRNAGGNITGVLAATGAREFEIKTGRVIIATGSFSNNPELLRRHCVDYYEAMLPGRSPYHTGDGLLMAEAIGAGIAATIPISHQGPMPASGLLRSAGMFARNGLTVWVNSRGRRFIDEAGFTVWENGNAIAAQPGGIMYAIFDDAARQRIEDHQPATGAGGVAGASSFAEEVRQAAPEAEGMMSDRWDTIADWIGTEAKTLRATLEEYNEACERGYDDIFTKKRECLVPLRQAPYYAVRCTANCGETLGGIKINERMEALDTGGEVIPGLYVAGVIADGWQAQTYCAETQGSTFGFAINSGRIAGENAAKSLRRGKA